MLFGSRVESTPDRDSAFTCKFEGFLGRGPGLWHMDYASAWEEEAWIMDYGLWIMSSSSDECGLWIMDYEPVNKTRREVDYGLWKP